MGFVFIANHRVKVDAPLSAWMLILWNSSLNLQDGRCGRTAVGATEMDPLLRKCHVHYLPSGAE